MMTYEEALVYIRNVLNNWTSWKEHHQTLTEALAVIVKHLDDEGDNH
jgi:hypothetical protein